MKAQTDLTNLKRLAQTFLMMDITITSHSPLIVTHPFTDSRFVGLKGDAFPSNLLENENALLRWREQMKAQINECNSAHQIFMRLTKPHRMVFLRYAETHLSQKDFSEILSDVWIQTEAPHNNLNFTTAGLVRLLGKADPAHLMNEDEYKQFQELDNTLTVCRGVTSYNVGHLFLAI